MDRHQGRLLLGLHLQQRVTEVRAHRRFVGDGVEHVGHGVRVDGVDDPRQRAHQQRNGSPRKRLVVRQQRLILLDGSQRTRHGNGKAIALRLSQMAGIDQLLSLGSAHARVMRRRIDDAMGSGQQTAFRPLQQRTPSSNGIVPRAVVGEQT
jgi:hypothetical protein